MSSERKPDPIPGADASQSGYESALFGDHSTAGFDIGSEMTEYNAGDPEPPARPDLDETVPARIEPRMALQQPIVSKVGRVAGLAANQIFADHRLTRYVSSDRIGDLWLAFDSELQCRRAIKIMRPEVAREPRAVEMFFRAVRAQAQLKHANIVQIIRVGRHETIPYYIAEWVEGTTLAQWLSHEGTVPVSVAWDVMRQVLVALNHAHSQGQMHRDVSPENILVEPVSGAEGSRESRRLHARVMYFGMSSVLDRAKDATLGTPASVSYGAQPEYVAPEVVTGMQVDFRADIYSAGLLLYHMLVGFPPFRGNTRGDILFKQVHDPMPALPPMVREGLGPSGMAILKRMTEKLPPQRFPSYKELLEAVFAAPLLTDRRKSDHDKADDYLDVPADKSERRPIRIRNSKESGLPSWLVPALVAAVVVGGATYGVLAWKKSGAEKPTEVASVPATRAAAPTAAPVVQSTPLPAAPPVSAALPPVPTSAPAASEVLAKSDAEKTAAMPPLPPVQPLETSADSAPEFTGNELVLDDAAPGVLKLDPPSGWMTTAGPGSYKSHSLLASADGSLKTATFSADVPEQGEYDLSLWWVPGDPTSRSSKVICTVFTTTGPFRGTLDQTGSSGSGSFFPIGHYTLPAGKHMPIVSISTEGMPASSSQMVSVDALRVTKTSSSPAAAGSPSASSTKGAAGTVDKVIIEAGTDGINRDHYKEITGKWIDSRTPPNAAKSAASGLTEQGKIGSRKAMFGALGDSATDTETASARFYPKFGTAGHYHVYVTWPHGGNANPVNYVVHHAGGEATRTFAQDGYGLRAGASSADSWIDLGDYDFTTGEDQYVEIQLNAGARPSQNKVSGQVYADAVCFSATPLPDAKTLTSAPPEFNPKANKEPAPPGIAGPLSGNAI